GEQRRAAPRGQRLPRVVLMVDSWEGFVASYENADGGALVDAVQALLREGASAGIHLVLTGDRALLTGRVASLVQERLALRLLDPADSSFVGLSPRSIPAELGPGRGFWAGSGTEVQVAVLGPDPGGPGQREAVAAIAALLRDR